MYRTVLILGAALALGGCASVPDLKYHTLDLSTAAAPEPADFNVAVDQIRVVEALRRPELLIKTGNTDIEYYAEHQWAGGLAELVEQKLAAGFGAREAGRETILVYGTILAFEQVDMEDGIKAHVKLSVQFRRDGESRYKAPLIERIYENDPAQEPALVKSSASLDETASAVIKALSDQLGVLTQEIRRDAAHALELAKAQAGAAAP